MLVQVQGSDWNTRALTATVLKGGLPVANVNPTSPITLSSSNQWTSWPGLQASVEVPGTCTVMATYQTSGVAMSSHVLSKLYIDGVEQTQTRAIAGNTAYGSNAGFYIGTLKAGSHAFDVKYRTPSSGNTMTGGDWQTRALNVAVVNCE